MKRKIGLVAALALIALMAIYLTGLRNQYFDSKVYYGAVVYWFRDHGMVYDWLRAGTPYGFTYPPFAGLAMMPMAYLPMIAVMVVATVATVLTTGVLTTWFTRPMVKKYAWPAGFAFTVAALIGLTFEPVRETITFGQVNTLLLTLVAGDMLLGLARGRKWAGVGIGLATAIKLTPGVFILYLLVTRRWRAAFTSMGTAFAATMLAAALFPDESREFWTSALWDTNRVGVLSFISNQSERGMIARLGYPVIESKLWAAAVLITLAAWGWRVARRRDDIMGGLALTGVVGCLVSPVTWVHHCVWLMPALARCVDGGLSGLRRYRARPRTLSVPSAVTTTTPTGGGVATEAAIEVIEEQVPLAPTPSRRFAWFPLALAIAAYVVLSSHLTWLWEHHPRGWLSFISMKPLAFVGSNLYVWFGLGLLLWTPLTRRPSRAEAALTELTHAPVPDKATASA